MSAMLDRSAGSCAISADHYREILAAALAAGYHVQSLAQYLAEPRTPALLLRHDVDTSIQTAVRMAEIEREAGVSASYFIRVHAAGYNPFSRESYVCLGRLLDEGFEVGLHHEVGVFPMDGTAAEQLRRELAVLDAILDRRVRSIAMHLPKRGTLAVTPSDMEANGILYEAGASIFNSGAQFISDSNRLLKPACPCTLIGAAPKIYAQIHPVWWMSPAEDVETLRQTLLRGD